MREHVLSVTKDDCEIQTFCAGGKGGQHQNKVATAVRIIHRASGAVGVARDTRSQHANMQAAFKRMAESEKFQKWVRVECARRKSGKTIEQLVEEQMVPKNIKTEVRDESGKWVTVLEGHFSETEEKETK